MGHILSSSIFYNRIPETKFLLNLYLFQQEIYLGHDSGGFKVQDQAGASRKGSRAASQPGTCFWSGAVLETPLKCFLPNTLVGS